MNTDTSTRTIAITGPATSSMAFLAASLGDEPAFHVALDVFDHHDRIIHDEPDAQHHTE